MTDVCVGPLAHGVAPFLRFSSEGGTPLNEKSLVKTLQFCRNLGHLRHHCTIVPKRIGAR